MQAEASPLVNKLKLVEDSRGESIKTPPLNFTKQMSQASKFTFTIADRPMALCFRSLQLHRIHIHSPNLIFPNCPPKPIKNTVRRYCRASSMENPPQGYRRNVGICLISPSKKGGVVEGEDPRDAVMRELREETGVTSAEIVAEVPYWLTYGFPPHVRKKLNQQWGTDWKGQAQKRFQFTGNDEEINLLGDRTEKAEFGEWTWMSPEQQDPVWVCTKGTFLQIQQTLVQKCAKQKSLAQGKSCHAQIIHFGLQADTSTSNMLINLYSKCGLVDYSRKVFDQMRVRGVVSWNTMIGAYTQNGDGETALGLFVRMLREGSKFSEFALSSVLCACATKVLAFESKQLHALAVKTSMGSNPFVGTALVDVYAKCHMIKDALEVFESLSEKSDVTWSSMMAGFVQNELYEEALLLFRRAQRTDVGTNTFMISSVLCSCSALAALIEGRQVHSVVHKTGCGANVYITSSLVDVYAKCGSIQDSYAVFSDAQEKNVVLYNTMISGLARNARSIEAMVLFEKMQQMFLSPTEVTYVSLLSACAHMGLAEEGRKYFDLMTKEHRLLPNVFHYSCMVDILGRTGKIDEANGLIETMPFEPTASMWGSLLASCRVYRNVELAEVAAKKLFEIEPNNAGNHVLLSNIYAANGRWDDVAAARKLLKDGKAKKEKGKSWIEIKDKVHSFMVGGRSHPRIMEVYSRLDKLLEDMEKSGFRGDVEHDLHDVEESYKKELLKHHSEKLAFTFGLMCLPSEAPIRIMKNLRICGDCHAFMKVASSVTGREIIVRDNNRFHHFREGYCSCGGFW